MRKFQRTRLGGKGKGAGTVLLCVVGLGGVAKGQSVLAPMNSFPTTPPAVQEMDEQGMGYIKGMTPTFPTPDLFLTWGPVALHPHLSYGATYANGLLSSPGSGQASFVQRFSPGMSAGIGTHWTADYTPTITFYSDKNLRDTVDQSASLNWGTTYEDWTMGFTQTFGRSDDPSVQTGTQTSTESFGTTLTASHALNSVLSLDFSLTQSILDADQFTSTKSWSTMEWLNYQFWPRLDAGIGVGYGYDAVSQGPNMGHEQLQGRISWRVTDKLSLVVHGGGEDRQYLGAGVPDTLDPVYGVGLSYSPFRYTALSLNVDRSTAASLFDSQVTESTSVEITFGQRFFEKYSFNLTGTYNTVQYEASAVNVPLQGATLTVSMPGREDTTYGVNAGLTWSFLKRASATLSYTYSRNSSSAGGFSFASDQVGIELDYHF